MARIKRSVNALKKRRKVLRLAKGYYGAKSKLYRAANQQVMKSLAYAYVGRKLGEARISQTVDFTHQRRRKNVRHIIQPLDKRLEGCRYRYKP